MHTDKFIKSLFLSLALSFPALLIAADNPPCVAKKSSVRISNLDFRECAGENYILFFRGKDGDAQKKIKILDHFHAQEYSQFFSKQLNGKMKVFLFKNKAEYHGKTKVPKEFHAHFSPEKKEIYSAMENETGPLLHETVHFWLNYNTGGGIVRPWFEEGFASFFEAPEIKPDGTFVFDSPNWRQKSLSGKWTGLETFMQRIDLREEHDKAQGRLFFLWLSKNSFLVPYVKKYLENLDFDFSGTDALTEITGKSLNEIDSSMKELSEKILISE